MNLLISEEGEVLGQTLSPENAFRQAMIARTSMYACTSKEELKKLPKVTCKLLWEDYGARSYDDLWTTLKMHKFPYWGKVSVMKVLRSVFDDDSTFSQDDLMEIVPGATWISITTAMSMLKNKKYAKPGKPLVIIRVEGKYRRA